MRIDVFFTPAELERAPTRTVTVVIDVLRATTTIVAALAHGARSVQPTSSIEAAVRIAQSIGRDEVLLCGERRARRIDGFDLGNSPREFTPAVVADKSVIMTTTNGTPALIAGSAADRCLVAAFANLSAVAAEAAQTDAPIVLLCAGREGRFSLDDALCAGALIAAIRSRRAGAIRMNDAALAATALERRYHDRLPAVVARTGAARQIIDAGLTEDIAYCLSVDRHAVVPVMSDRHVIL
ncbi:MAG: 2-phosphosulfolactate phosphatase [Gemmatimonadota bacterium]